MLGWSLEAVGIRAMKPDEKSVSRMKGHVTRLSKAWHLAKDLCAGTLSVASPCMMFSKHRRFVGCQNDAGCFNAYVLCVV